MNLACEPQLPAARLSGAEKAWLSPVEELAGEDVPYWIIGRRVAGWMQRVVDHFQGYILFVQAGTDEGNAIRLGGVLHHCGPMDTRMLARLVYHSRGVIAPDALLGPLAGAVETQPGLPMVRPNIAGTRSSRKTIAQITAHLEQNPSGRLTARQSALAARVLRQGERCCWAAAEVERVLFADG